MSDETPAPQNRFPLHVHGPIQVYALDVGPSRPGIRYEVAQLAGDWSASLQFQDGAVAEHGVNGWTNEGLISVLIDRTLKLNSRFPCQENIAAVRFLSKALEAFNERTQDRSSRGVEGQQVQ